jgi:hypothetical protein
MKPRLCLILAWEEIMRILIILFYKFFRAARQGRKIYFLKIQRNPKIPRRPAIIRKRLVGSGRGAGAMAEATLGIKTRERTESRR